MRWPWKPDPKQRCDREHARQLREQIESQWGDVYEAVAPLREGMARNHLIERAFALRERGDR